MKSDRSRGTAGSDTPSRRAAARHLLHPDRFRDSLALSAQPSLRNSALTGAQAGLTAAIALPLFLISPWPQLIGFAASGRPGR